MERSAHLAAAIPLLWLGACASDSGEAMLTPGIGSGPMAGASAFGASGSVAMPPLAGIGGGAGTPANPGTSGMSGTSGAAGVGTAGTAAGTGATAGAMATAGTGGIGSAATGGTGGGTAGASGTAGSAGMGAGACCDDGDCLCHGPAPSGVTTENGSYDTAEFRISTGTVYYPTDAEPPLAGVALCGGFLNTGPEMAGWGPFYASHGIVTVITTTTGADLPDLRATKLLAAVEELKGENTRMDSPLFGKLSDRFGTSGYSMGGGGTTIAAADESSLKTSVGLAPWGPVGAGIQVPTLLLCGASDTTAPCNMAQGSYGQIPEATPKMILSISGATHFSWFGPQDAGRGTSGAYALAFQKVFLEGDERWKPVLLERPSSGTVTTNIQ